MFGKQRPFMTVLACAALALGTLAAAPAFAAVENGKPAPDFTATDIHGKEIKLSEFKGKNVVLEWTNHQCPFVVKHYSTGNMQALQKRVTDNGDIWITIVSSATGKQGHMSAEDAKALEAEAGAKATTRIMDETSAIAYQYGAKVTPHMYVINAEGTLVYQGAIDDQPSPDIKTVETAQNYVTAALEDIAAGREVATPMTTAYGCGIKYPNT